MRTNNQIVSLPGLYLPQVLSGLLSDAEKWYCVVVGELTKRSHREKCWLRNILMWLLYIPACIVDLKRGPNLFSMLHRSIRYTLKWPQRCILYSEVVFILRL